MRISHIPDQDAGRRNLSIRRYPQPSDGAAHPECKRGGEPEAIDHPPQAPGHAGQAADARNKHQT